MAEQLKLEIVTPQREVVNEVVDMVVAPGVYGEFGVLINHIPFLTSLQTGELYYKKGDGITYIAIDGGFAEVQPDKVTILAEAAEIGLDIDLSIAMEAKARAEKRLIQLKDKIEYARVEAELKRAITHISVAKKTQGN